MELPYMNSSASNLKRLDTIQYKSLLIVTGGMIGTSLDALLGECSELPLSLRREQILIKYLFKIIQKTSNAASSIFQDQKYFQLEINAKSPFNDILNGFLKDNGITLGTNCSFFYKKKSNL